MSVCEDSRRVPSSSSLWTRLDLSGGSEAPLAERVSPGDATNQPNKEREGGRNAWMGSFRIIQDSHAGID